MTNIASLFTAKKNLVIVERCPAPPPKPPTVIYEKYLPQPVRQRQVIVQRERCVQPASVAATCAPSCLPTRRLLREIVRHVPQPTPAVVCRSEQEQQISPAQSQTVEQLVPVFATRQVS